MPPTLPQIDSCTDCGACCERTPIPPFLPGEAELLNVPFAWLVAIRDRIAADLQFDLLPCVWYDIATRRCLHYAHRPAACRDFERNSQPCRSVRQLQAEQTQTPE